jgi:hypothetical protein
MNTMRLTPELEAEIHARFRDGRCSGLDVAYLLDELDAMRKDREGMRAFLVLRHLKTPEKAPCRHGAWEADETGVQCCVFCGVTADSGKVKLA